MSVHLDWRLIADFHKERATQLEVELGALKLELARSLEKRSADAFTAMMVSSRGPTLHAVHSHHVRELVIGAGFGSERQ